MNAFGEAKSYPELPTSLRAQLASVPTSGGFYHPCDVTLRSGALVERVYLVPADRYIVQWGVWPEDDHGKRAIDVSAVVSVRESSWRLPPRFADELHRAGESGMGYTIFTVVFKDGSSMATHTGNAVDFVRYPQGQSAKTVKQVVPHRGRNDPGLKAAPDYHWCLYSE